MVSYSNTNETVLRKEFLLVETASSLSGYSVQYLRRLLRTGKLSGVKLGRMWMLDIAMFKQYLKNANQKQDGRWGPKSSH